MSEIRNCHLCLFSVDFLWRTLFTFLKCYLNITFADNELVKDKEGEDDSHGEGGEAKLVGVDLYFSWWRKRFGSRYLLTDPSTRC